MTPGIAKNMALNSTENALKNIYLSHPERHLDLPCDYEEVKDVFDRAYAADNLMKSEKLPESSFIENNMDCALIRHMRYTPANWHMHEFFELLYVINGTCINTFSDRSFDMKPGDICISAPGSVHSISAFSDDAIMINILLRKTTFEHAFLGLLDEDDILASFFRRALYSSDTIPYLLFHTGQDKELFSIADRIYNEYHANHRFRRQMVNTLLSEFFVLLLRKYEQYVESPFFGTSEHAENIIYILRYIQENAETVTLGTLASFSNYSERQLQRIIEHATNMSFSTLIQTLRMKKAASLLKESDLSIEMVCEQTGYASANNFRRVFSKHFGCTPKEYRKAYKVK